MLKKAQNLLALIALLVMTNGCGEGFRSIDRFQTEESTAELFDQQGNRRNLSTPDNDQFIMQSYANELNGTELDSVRLTQRVQAFDMIMEGLSDGGLSLNARLMISCNETYSFKREIVIDQLRALQVQRLGRQGDYEVEVRCSQRDCNEMVAAIRKFRGVDRGTVLVGLAIGGQGGTQVLFVSRSVRYAPYFASFPNVISYGESNSCEFEDPDSPDDEPDSIEELLTDRAVEIGREFLEENLGELIGNVVGDGLDDLFSND